jgi:geranylgeranyl reductase family protein
MSPATADFDVVVVGAGPGGSATAASLAQQGLSTLLLDKSEFPRDKTCGDALSPRALQALQVLGLRAQVEASGYRLDSLKVTGPEGEHATIPIPSEDGFPRFSLTLKRYQLDRLIAERAVQRGAKLVGGFHVDRVETEAQIVTVSGHSHHDRASYRARAVVLAVGANLALLKRLHLLPANPDLSLAARAYFSGITDLDPSLSIRFDGLPLPGYGWIFPLSKHEANIGAGISLAHSSNFTSSQQAMDHFLEHRSIRRQLLGSQQLTKASGFPLRMDFHRSPSFRDRVLLVGEAAGLVNPFTGEGVDYALESARLAASALIAAFSDEVDLNQCLREYDRSLRRRFQQVFVLTHWLRRLYMRPGWMDPLLRACRRWPDLGTTLLRILLAYESPSQALLPNVMLKVLWAKVNPSAFA